MPHRLHQARQAPLPLPLIATSCIHTGRTVCPCKHPLPHLHYTFTWPQGHPPLPKSHCLVPARQEQEVEAGDKWIPETLDAVAAKAMEGGTAVSEKPRGLNLTPHMTHKAHREQAGQLYCTAY